MLLIPYALRKRKEIKQEARREGRREIDDRYREAVKRFGVEVNGVTMLPWTPEVQEFIQAEPGQPEK